MTFRFDAAGVPGLCVGATQVCLQRSSHCVSMPLPVSRRRLSTPDRTQSANEGTSAVSWNML